MVLHSNSTGVDLPEPTGPPTPTRSGGSFLLRWGMVCSAEIMPGDDASSGQTRPVPLRQPKTAHANLSAMIAALTRVIGVKSLRRNQDTAPAYLATLVLTVLPAFAPVLVPTFALNAWAASSL